MIVKQLTAKNLLKIYFENETNFKLLDRFLFWRFVFAFAAIHSGQTWRRIVGLETASTIAHIPDVSDVDADLLSIINWPCVEDDSLLPDPWLLMLAVEKGNLI